MNLISCCALSGELSDMQCLLERLFKAMSWVACPLRPLCAAAVSTTGPALIEAESNGMKQHAQCHSSNSSLKMQVHCSSFSSSSSSNLHKHEIKNAATGCHLSSKKATDAGHPACVMSHQHVPIGCNQRNIRPLNTQAIAN